MVEVAQGDEAPVDVVLYNGSPWLVGVVSFCVCSQLCVNVLPRSVMMTNWSNVLSVEVAQGDEAPVDVVLGTHSLFPIEFISNWARV